jgi:head-tail adaptor
MDSGQLNKRITIKQLSKTSDGYGGTTSTKTTLATVWGKVVEKKGDVEMDGFKRERKLEVKIIVRKKTADDYITIDRILSIAGKSGEYRVSGIFESQIDHFTQIEAIKID